MDVFWEGPGQPSAQRPPPGSFGLGLAFPPVNRGGLFLLLMLLAPAGAPVTHLLMGGRA